MAELITQIATADGNSPLVFLGDKLVSVNPIFVPQPPFQIDYLVVAGGGACGQDVAGGGGAGGLKSGSFTPTNSATITTILGAGATFPKTKGDSSSITSAIVNASVTGGGRGGANQFTGSNGGSGGGGGGGTATPPTGNVAGGTGISGEGFNGATGGVNTGAPGEPPLGAGGGGGASQAGISNVADNLPGGAGGSGSLWLDGNFYAGGGGGAGAGAGTGGPGGPGGGGDGASSNTADGTAGEPNTGGGGGGSFVSSAGGSGVIIFRYPSSALIVPDTVYGGDEKYEDGGYTYHKFTSVATSSLVITF